jgi:dihydropteroate synthase
MSQTHSDTFEIRCKHGSLNLNVPAVMGILNVTPDSFYDGGRYRHEEAILIRAEQMIEEGVSIIDIGASSTRPGAKPVSEKEEMARLLPAISSIREHFPEILISADTYRANTAEEAVRAGADIINDIAGGSLDPDMFSRMGKLKVPYVLMHIQGQPQHMQEAPSYTDVCKEVKDYFTAKIKTLKNYKVEQIIFDPGFGFGKSVQHNFELLDGLHSFLDLGYPLLAGLSRKSMINKTLGTKPESSLTGTIAANTIALLKGAAILRVHDVKEAVETIKIVQALHAAKHKS